MPKAANTPTTPLPTLRRVPSDAPTVTEYTPTRRSHRRRFLVEAGATLAASLGVTAAVLSPDPVWGAPVADAGLDAALIAACERFIRANNAYNADRSGLDFRIDPLWHELEAAEEAAQAIPARTLAGVAAKARVAVVLGTNTRDGTVRLCSSYAGSWPGDVVRDVLRLAGEVVA